VIGTTTLHFSFDLVYLPKNGAPYLLSLRESLISLPLHLKILLITHVSLGKKKVINTWCCNPNLKSKELLQTPLNSSEELLQTPPNKRSYFKLLQTSSKEFFSYASIHNIITRVRRNSSDVFGGVNFNSFEHIKRVPLSASKLIGELPLWPSDQTNPNHHI
jgi:hypothetical protein